MEIITWLRSWRIMNIALFDLVTSIIGTELLFRHFLKVKWLGAALAIPIGMIVHRLIGVKTQL